MSKFEQIDRNRFGLVGYLYTPDDCTDAPLIVYLGGQGEVPNSWGLMKMIKEGYRPKAYVYAPANQYVGAAGIHYIVTKAASVLNVKHVHIFGYSLGGHQGLQMISDNPYYYANAVILGAYPNASFPCYSIYTKPTTSFIVYCGQKESAGIRAAIETFAATMKKNNRKIEFHSLPDIRHTEYGCVVDSSLIERLISL